MSRLFFSLACCVYQRQSSWAAETWQPSTSQCADRHLKTPLSLFAARRGSQWGNKVNIPEVSGGRSAELIGLPGILDLSGFVAAHLVDWPQRLNKLLVETRRISDCYLNPLGAERQYCSLESSFQQTSQAAFVPRSVSTRSSSSVPSSSALTFLHTSYFSETSSRKRWNISVALTGLEDHEEKWRGWVCHTQGNRSYFWNILTVISRVAIWNQWYTMMSS